METNSSGSAKDSPSASRRVRKYAYDTRRGTRHQRGYTNRWARAAKRHLKANPLCIVCKRPATLVDHIRPHNGDARLFWRTSNWQSLCHACHNTKTAAERQGQTLRIIGVDGWPIGEDA